MLLALVLVASAAFQAAPASAAQPATIKLVSPMRVTIGETITIRGSGFSSSRRRNTVIFRAPSKRTAFAKPRSASARKLVVSVPGSVERLLSNRNARGAGDPTRFTLRVVVNRRYGKRSARRNSPVVVSALKSGKPAACGTGVDFDNDLLTNTDEAQIKTDPCSADTDGDGVEDGFEQTSARDLNQRAVPYPGKRPFPNALDPTDAYHDYDGDGLSNSSEFRAWAHAPANPAPSLLQGYSSSPKAPPFGGPWGDRPRFEPKSIVDGVMLYSDGKQTTKVVPGEFQPYLDLSSRNPGILTDAERDVDGDGLRNIDERHELGPAGTLLTSDPPSRPDLSMLMVAGYYAAGDPCDFKYDPILERPFLEPDYLDWDSDGDGVWDGNDDQDNDDISNADEIQPPYVACGPDPESPPLISPLPVNGARDGSDVVRNPFNPCLPDGNSRTCELQKKRD